MKKKLHHLIALLILSVSIATAQTKDKFINVNSGVKYSYIGTYDVARLNSILTKESAKFCDYKISYPV